jgi:diguanylate cyclase (GGDEF)-like protein
VVSPLRPRRFALRIRSKFLLVFLILVPVIFATPVVGIYGLSQVRDDADALYSDNVRTTLLVQQTAAGIDDAFQLALEMIPATASGNRLRLNQQLEVLHADVDRDIAALGRPQPNDTPWEHGAVVRIAAGWEQFLALWRDGAFDFAGSRAGLTRHNELTARRVAEILNPVSALADRLSARQADEARDTHTRTIASFQSTRLKMLAFAAVSIMAALSTVLWLIRDIVPRTRSYSRFAAGVASGAASEPIQSRGSDELAELGESLNEMVAQREAERVYGETQLEFADAMQVTESEQEAHGLLKRHLERTIPDSTALVLNRNNSHDRLEPTTSVTAGSALEEALLDAGPRSCLAVRFARRHEEGPGRAPLLECDLCGKRASARSTCQPLLVSGEVIGSVLVEHAHPLAAEHGARIRTSVVQAAPVLANLRNLAVAQLRAATDALTGLPNKRALQGDANRMVAHASRTGSGLALAFLDLDHFKQVNDTYGHGKGDEVLAAVGAALHTTVRESDIAGRWGGEEFMILFADVDRPSARVAAEKLREAVEGIKVVGVERAITASVGVAVLPEDGGDVTTLTRSADRALYAAKAAGRNRVEMLTPEGGNGLAHGRAVLSS